MDLTNVERILGKVAATLGIIQGAAWFAMSLACIIIYNKGVEFDCSHPPESHLDSVNENLYFWFLNKNYEEISDLTIIVTPHIFTIFMWLYAFLDFGWMLISILLFNAIVANHYKISNHIIGWIALTTWIMCLDLVLSILIGIDFNTCRHANIVTIVTCSSEFQENVTSQVLYDTIMPVLIIAGKGYILWIINLVLVVLLFRACNNEIQTEFIFYKRGLIPNNRIPRATLQKIPKFYTQYNTPSRNDYGRPSDSFHVNDDIDIEWPKSPKGFNDGKFPSTPAIYSSQHSTLTRY